MQENNAVGMVMSYVFLSVWPQVSAQNWQVGVLYNFMCLTCLCNMSPQTTDHLLWECELLRKQRQVLKTVL
jgi:endonuclease/exonuclease/phosphatase (EEP) superfamily protein YafD